MNPAPIHSPLVNDKGFVTNSSWLEWFARFLEDLVVDSSTKGLVVRDSQAPPHYWRIRPDGTGSLTLTDLGTTKP
jgi:hypothetical protein